MFIMGIDPGAKGGIGIISLNGQERIAYSVANKTPREVAQFIEHWIHQGLVICFLEKIRAFPGDKRYLSSFAKLVDNYGQYKGMLHAFRIPFEEVTPAKWQTFMKCRTGGDKNISKARAEQLFPDIKVTHYVADAMLIAEYGRKTWL